MLCISTEIHIHQSAHNIYLGEWTLKFPCLYRCDIKSMTKHVSILSDAIQEEETDSWLWLWSVFISTER